MAIAIPAFPTVTRKQLLSASGLAMATALVAAAPALRAQSFQGTVTSGFGDVNIFQTGSVTSVTVNSPSAVINWVPNDTAATGGPINFQPAGTVATFTNNPDLTSDFAVLNRIIPSGSTRPIQFNGLVVSQLQNAAGGSAPGGTVFFYSPGGIVIGASAVFDVGNLALTTSDLAYDSAGNFDFSGAYEFQPATVAGSQIVVQAGALVNSSTDGSYVALVAPSIVNDGVISVNGSAALVAADAATITFSPSGLFDIEVTSGSSASGTAIANNGAVTGAAATAAVHRVYMVAVPKNDALTMAIGSSSSLGFDIAGAADVDGNAIILSGGHDVIGGQVTLDRSAGGGSGNVSITGSDADFTSAVTGRATGAINLTSNVDTGLNFASDVFLHSSSGTSLVAANAGGFVNVGGNLEFRGDVAGDESAIDAQAAKITLRAADGGYVMVAGDLLVSADGQGGAALQPDTASGNGLGGVVTIEAVNGGSLNVAGDLVATADGWGGSSQFSQTGGGAGTGGAVNLKAIGTGSALQVDGALYASAAGAGGSGFGCTVCAFDGGAGVAGQVTLMTSGGDASLTVAGPAELAANASGGSGLLGDAGAAIGGTVVVEAFDGGAMYLDQLSATANAEGGYSPALGGSATGGSINLAAHGTGLGGIFATGALNLQADAFGGSGDSPAGSGAAATGGTIYVGARDEKTVDIQGGLQASANAYGGSGYTGSLSGTGGAINVDTQSAGRLSVAADLVLSAQGNGGGSYEAQAGGLGTGGLVALHASGGELTVSGSSLMFAAGQGGYSGSGVAGDGVGGTAQVSTSGSGSISIGQSALVSASGTGGYAELGVDSAGGAGIGGDARLDLDGGQFSTGGDFSLVAEGYGGGAAGVGGNGQGGAVSAFANAADIAISGTSYFGASGSGSISSFSGTGGSGTGGTVNFTASESTVNLSSAGSAIFEATGYGAGGIGLAAGTGGTIALIANGSTISVASGQLSLFAEGQAGQGYSGADGGIGTGGSITLAANAGSVGTISAGTIAISATGRGGLGDTAVQSPGGQVGADGGNGGNAQGGTVNLVAAADGGIIMADVLTVQAAAVGGLGGNGFDGIDLGGQGGSGGAATGGTIAFDTTRANGVDSGGFKLGIVVANSGALGGNGGLGGSGTVQGGAGAGGAALGGAIFARFDDGGSLFEATSGADFRVDAAGGSAGTCVTTCAVSGGNAQGGSIQFMVGGGSNTGNSVAVGSSLVLSAFAEGGDSHGVTGGTGTGGNVLLRVGSGGVLDLAGMELDVSGIGGDELSGLAGGAGTGGTAQFIGSAGGSADISTSVAIYAIGSGGDGLGSGGSGGSALGGTSRFFSNGGAVTVGGDAIVLANAFGGAGDLASASGAGGSGTGGTALLTVGTPDLAGNTGSISVSGLTRVSADGNGGDGWAAGNGLGGFVGIAGRSGLLDLGTVLASTAGYGGYGVFGGNGGAGTGGTIEIVANSGPEGPSLVQIDSLFADATGYGGLGALAGVPGGAGGAGGNAQGGSVLIIGTAGNGVMNITDVYAGANAYGGEGGLGGVGGAGGSAQGGFVQVGLASGLDTGTVNGGAATYGTINVSTTATGGAGGEGGQGSAINGVGGDGGNAVSGNAVLLVRGAPVTVTGLAQFDASALGGSGGAGPVSGNGGDATVVDSLNLVATNRFNQPAQSGSLTAADLAFTAVAVGGAGNVAGASQADGTPVVLNVVNSAVSANSLQMLVDAQGVAGTAAADTILIDNGSLALNGEFVVSTPNALSLKLDQAMLTAADVVISAGNFVPAATAPTFTGTVFGTNSITLNSGLDIVAFANLRTNGALTLSALRNISLGALDAVGYIDIVAGGSVSLAGATSGDSIDIEALGPVQTGDLIAATSVNVESQGSLTLGNLAAGVGTPTGANGDLYSIGLLSGGNVQTGTLAAASDVGVAASGTITTGAISGYDGLFLGGGNIALGGLAIVNRVLIADSTMASLGFTPAGFDKELVFAALPVATTGSIVINGASTAGSIQGITSSSITTSGISANGGIGFVSGGNGVFGALQSTGGDIELISRGGTINLGSANAAQRVLASAASGLTVGLASGGNVALLSGGDITVQQARAGVIFSPTGAITSATGTVLLANASMLSATARPGSVDYTALFTGTPVATGGRVTIGGSAIGGRIVSVSSGDMTGSNLIGFGAIRVESGGLVTVQQRWTSANVNIFSNDIAVPASATGLSGIVTGQSGVVNLISRSSSPALIGDGLTGSGYTLTNAEIGRISTGQLAIAAPDQAASAVDMLVGNLTLTAGGATGATTTTGLPGRIIFATGNPQTQTAGGAIRVVGNITGTGFTASDVLEFSTGRFELDAATGSISLTQSGTTLGGLVEINAANIHVASGTILDRLAADPFYSGRIADLNAPAAVQRPDGVLRALGLELYPSGTLYIQNTGTVLDPAGFLADYDLTTVELPQSGQTGTVSLIVNGKWQTPDGLITGTAVHDVVLENSDNLGRFSADSQINGCLLTTTNCQPVVNETTSNPTPAISSQIEMIGTAGMGSTPAFAESPAGGDADLTEEEQERAQDEAEKAVKAEEAATSPIVPPVQLIDTQPLEPTGVVEQPVAGSGNPALIGSVVNEGNAQGDGQ